MTHEYAVRLGRRPSTPDDRNWQLFFLPETGGLRVRDPRRGMLETADPLDVALSAFLRKRYSNEAKTLARVAVERIKAVSPPTPAPPVPTTRKLWELGAPGVLDQGDTPHCVGYTGVDFENLDPVEDHVAGTVGDELYYECKIIDGEPGQENGSSIHSLAKVLKNRGRVNAYAFMSDIATVRAYVRDHGPVPIGIDWTEDMFTPNTQGFIAPTGAVAGGHALTVVGDYPDLDAAVILNHWGPNWGLNGYCLMKWADLATLLSSARDGEAVGMLELPV